MLLIILILHYGAAMYTVQTYTSIMYIHYTYTYVGNYLLDRARVRK